MLRSFEWMRVRSLRSTSSVWISIEKSTTSNGNLKRCIFITSKVNGAESLSVDELRDVAMVIRLPIGSVRCVN